MQQHDILPVLHRRKSKKEDDVARQDGADAALEDGADAADVVVTCATADIDDTFLSKPILFYAMLCQSKSVANEC